MKATELRTKKVSELQDLLTKSREELIENKRSLAAGELPNPRVVGKNRRDIARILSVLAEKVNETSKEGEA
jgi:ribosomal protein L29